MIGEFEQAGPARYLIYERLGRFGTVAIDPLEQLLERSDVSELRVLACAARFTLEFEKELGGYYRNK